MTRDQKLWRSAIDANEAALLVNAKDTFPIDWAQIKVNLGHIYFTMAQQTGHRDFAVKAVGEYDMALPVLIHHNIALVAQICRYNRDSLAAIIAKEQR
jgi:hypothetical protein